MALVYAPNAGYVWNPAQDLPRNIPCPCGQGKKFKKCCLSKTPKVIKESQLETAKKAVAMYLSQFKKVDY